MKKINTFPPITHSKSGNLAERVHDLDIEGSYLIIIKPASIHNNRLIYNSHPISDTSRRLR